MPKTSADTTLRYLALLQLIPAAPERISVADLHQKLADRDYKITVRSVQRDLERLSTIFPLTCDVRGRTNHWFFSDLSALLQIPAMNGATALALKLAEDYLSSIMPPATLELLQPYFRRAQEVLERTRLGQWRSKVRIIRRGPELIPPKVAKGVQEAAYEALLTARQLRALYTGRGKSKSTEIVLNPLGVVARDGVVYLVATAWEYPDVRHFALHRMTEAAVLETTAACPAGFSLHGHVDDDNEFSYPQSRRRIKLKMIVNEYVAQHLKECRLSRDQKVTSIGEGKWRIEASVADTDELRWWLLGFGGGVRVLAPKVLKDEIEEWRRAAV